MADLKTNVTTLPENKVQLDIEVPPEEIKTEVEKTVRELSRDVKMPGFRPGKVPRNLVVQRFGKDAILAHVLEESMPQWLSRALTENGIKPVDQPEVELADTEMDLDDLLDENKQFRFKAVVPVMPKPKLGSYIGMNVDKDIVTVSEADIDEEVDLLRKRLAKLEAIPGERPAQTGDYVLIDFTGYLDSEPLEGGAGKDYMLELGSGTFIPGFEDQIAGMEKGQSKRIKLSFPEDYKPEHLAGKEVEFDVAAKEIKEKILPEADDGFAKENSEFDTIGEMRESISKRIEAGRQIEADKLFRGRAVEKALELSELEMPQPAIDTRAHELEMDFVTSLEAQGIGAEQYLGQSDEEKQKFSDHFKAQAEAVLKREAVLEAIAENEKIEVTDEEIEEEISKAAPRMGKEPDDILREMKAKGRLGIVRDDLIHKKAADLITEKAIPVLKKAGAASGAEKETAEVEAETETESAAADTTEA